MAEAAFKIDGVDYELPEFDTLNMDEAQILYECSGLAIEDFAIDESDSRQVEELEQKQKNPGLIKAMMVMALCRKGFTKKRAMDMIGSSNLFELLGSIESEEDPTEPQKSDLPTPATSTSSDEKPDSSGADLQMSLDPAEETPEATGISE